MAAARDWPPELAELWGRLEAYEFDHPGTAFTFAKRLARENGWSVDFAARAVEEYKRFAFLCVCEGPATPSFHVDQVWHLHLTFTRSYWGDFCDKVLRKPLHHDPTKGGPSEHERFWRQYSGTLRAYEARFGTPPHDLWPPPSLRFTRDVKYHWVNPEHYWLVPKPALPRPLEAVVRRAPELAGAVPLMPAAELAREAVARAVLVGLAVARRRLAGSRLTLLAVVAAAACSITTALAAEEGVTVVEDGSVGQEHEIRNAFLGSVNGFGFLVLYGLACTLSHSISSKVTGSLREAGYADTHTLSDLNSYHLAMLQAASKGASLTKSAVTACAFSLLQRGLWQGSGEYFHTVPGVASRAASTPGLRPLEKAMLGACGMGVKLEVLERHADVLTCVQSLKEQLSTQDLHLLMSKDASGRVKKAASLPGLLVVLGLGLPRLLGANGRPVGFLCLMMVAHTILVAVLYCKTPSQYLTRLGAKVLSDHEARYRSFRGSVTENTLNQDAAFAFALFDATAVSHGATLYMQMQPLHVARQSADTSAGGCGGGGCGGGGCGGCGG